MTPRKFYFIMLGLLGGALVLGIAGCVYGYFLVKDASGKLSDAMIAQNAADQEIANLNTTNANYRLKILPILDQIERAVPKTKGQTAILIQLQDTAAAAGLSLSSVSFTPVQGNLPSNTTQTIQSGSLLALPISFRIEGTFRQLQNFLVRIENLNRVTTVTSLSVTKSGSKTITYDMIINTYIMP